MDTSTYWLASTHSLGIYSVDTRTSMSNVVVFFAVVLLVRF